MNSSDLKRCFFLPVVYLIVSIFIFSSTAQAADVQVQLDNTSGSGLSVQNSSSVEKARVDNSGNLSAYGNVGIGTSAISTTGLALNVSQGGAAPEYAVGVGDAFIQNNLEVDGTTYLNDVYINGLEVNGATFGGGGPSMDTLTVNGNSYLGISGGNVGIGTYAAGGTSRLGVNGGVVIGSSLSYLSASPPTNGLAVQGNVGVNSTAPGEALDVQGETRTTNFTMTGQTPLVGYVLTASDSNGDTTWTPAGTVGGWTISGNNIYETNEAGNVGIGTTNPGEPLSVGLNAFTVTSNGAITASGPYTQIGNGANTLTGTTTFSAAGTSASFTGNVGIGSAIPGETLDVVGEVRTTNFTMTGQTPLVGYVLTASDSNGDTTWTPAGTVGGWTISGNNIYETNEAGNVGIGTTNPGEPLAVGPNAFTVNSNGAITTSGSYTQIGNGVNTLTGVTTFSANIGIGTANPGEPLSVGANAFTVNSSGAVATAGSYTQSGTGANTLTGTTTFSAAGTSASFTGNVGIGSATPGEALDVIGEVRTTNFTMTGQTPLVGYVLTASDSNGDTTWTPAGTVGGWTISGNNIYETNEAGNVGIGTANPGEPLSVGTNAFTVKSNGNIATVGSYTQSGNGINAFTGNVGIGSLSPSQTLDVNGTIRTTNFVMTGQTPLVGYVLTASDSNGDTTWTPAGTVGGWTIAGNDIYETNEAGNVGIGTTAPDGSLVVMNGNVGIGTWVPQALLSAGATSQFQVNSSGALTTAAITTSGAYTQSGNGINAFSGNVGIGSLNPGQALDVNGSIRTTNFTMTGQTPISGYVLTASDSNGDTTWTPAGTVGGWTISGNNIYETNEAGNVGIGTIAPAGALVVMNGNVGIGTWAPQALLSAGATSQFQVNSAGAVTTSGAYTQTGNGINSLSGNLGVGTSSPTGRLEIEGGNVGIGTAFTTAAGLSVMNGNVGIGTWVPRTLLEVSTSGGTVNPLLGAGGAYIQNNFEVNGTAYLNNATVAGTLSVATLELSGNSVFSSLEVTGNTFLGTISGNVGIGTTAAYGNLEIMKTASQPALMVSSSATNHGNYLMVANNGNVGIGSINPGQVLDVQGTARVTNFTMTGQTPLVGYVLTASDSNGDTTWTPAGAVGGWTITGNNIYETSPSGNVGIGTSTPQGALVVTNGNVGIGTWAPTASLAVGANAFTVTNAGVVNTSGAYTQTGSGTNTLSGTTTFSAAVTSALFTTGNVGIGSLTPGQTLDVTGTVRTTNFTMTGQTPISGYVLTASDSNGDATWSSAGAIEGWTVNGTNVYTTAGSDNVGIGTTAPTGKLEVEGGNVGIGTFLSPSGGTNNLVVNGNVAVGTTFVGGTGEAALAVMNGNVGIGTWVPANNLSIVGTVAIGSAANVGIGQPADSLYVQGDVGIGTQANSSQGLIINSSTDNSVLYSLAASSANSDLFEAIINSNDRSLATKNLIWKSTSGFSDISFSPSTGAVNALVMKANGTVGIGTASPGSEFTVLGNVGIGTTGSPYVSAAAPVNGMMVQGNVGIGTFANINGQLIVYGGNVGIGSLVPGQALDVNGSIRTTNFTMSGQTPISGYVLTASDSKGDATWSSAGAIEGWTVNGTNVYTTTGSNNVGIGTVAPTGKLEVEGGNVGIGTFLAPSGGTNNLLVNGNIGIGTTFVGGTGEASLSVMNGNVGIGTWAPGASLAVGKNAFTVTNAGAINTSGAYVQTGSGANTLSGATTFSATGTSASFTGNVGIGTTNPLGELVAWGGNVGIGTNVPGQALDVTGTIRTTNFTMSGQTPMIGYVLTASDTSGDTTWSSAGAIEGWTVNGTNVYTTTGSNNVGIGTVAPTGKLEVEGGNVGIGTFLAPSGGTNNLLVNGNIGIGTTFVGGTGEASLSVMNGNVGIGTWAPGASLAVGKNAFTVTNAGAINTSGAYVQTGSGANTLSGTTTFSATGTSASFTGNVGIGTTSPLGELIAWGGNVGIGTNVPGQALDVTGTIRTTNFTMSGQTPISGYVLTASDSKGDATWSSAGAIEGWTVNGANVYTTTGSNNVGIGTVAPTGKLEVEGGNVGIGTFLTPSGGTNNLLVNGNVGLGTTFVGGTGEAALSIMNGNVGIGTWAPTTSFAVGTNAFTVTNAGAINTPGAYTQTGSGANTLSGATTFSATGTSASFTGNVGIGTTNPLGKLIAWGGNVGIGTNVPGQALDVTGTIRTTNFTMTGQTPISGYVLTASDSNGDATWSSAGAIEGWTVNGTNVYTTTGSNNVGIGTVAPTGKLEVEGGNVGIGTFLAPSGGTNNLLVNGNIGIGTTFVGGTGEASLSVMNGNVGIGTWAPGASLAVGKNAFTVTNAGAINTSGAYVQTGSGANTLSGTTTFSATGTSASFTGNVGIGTTSPLGELIAWGGNVGIGTNVPGQALDVTGTIRTTNFMMTGQTPMIGYVLTASDTAGDTTWSSAGAIEGWTVNGTNVYTTTGSDNVGIGTNNPLSRLNVNGAVGIGTTSINSAYLSANSAPSGGLIVQGNVGIGTFNPFGGGLIVLPANTGNVGIGSLIPGQVLDVQGTVRASGNVGIGSSITDSGGSPRLTITASTVEVNLQ